MTKMFDVRNSGSFRRLRDTEKVATSIFFNQPLHIPGILQEPAYAQEAIAGIAGLPADDPEVVERVQVRNERHAEFLKRLQGENAPQVHVVLDEGVLRRAAAGSAAMRTQIEHLIEVSRKPTVQIGIIPLAHGVHPGMAGPFEVYDTADHSLVFVESAEGDAIVDGDPERISLYRDLVGTLMSKAASGEEARALMSELAGR